MPRRLGEFGDTGERALYLRIVLVLVDAARDVEACAFEPGGHTRVVRIHMHTWGQILQSHITMRDCKI